MGIAGMLHSDRRIDLVLGLEGFKDEYSKVCRNWCVGCSRMYRYLVHFGICCGYRHFYVRLIV